MPTEEAQSSTMTTEDTDIKLPMTELQIMADDPGTKYTVETINNVSSWNNNYWYFISILML